MSGETETVEKCYVVVRSDISHGYQIVQSCHAVAEHEKQFPGSMSGRTMIVLSVPNETILILIGKHLMKYGTDVTTFWEPDVSEYTAMAISPRADDYVALIGLPLAGSK